MELTKDIKSTIKTLSNMNINFYQIYYTNSYNDNINITNIVSFFSKDDILKVINKLDVCSNVLDLSETFSLSEVLQLIYDGEIWFPILFIETNKKYNDFEALAKDVLLYKLSGIL